MARGASFLYRAVAWFSFFGCAFPCRGKRPGARSKAPTSSSVPFFLINPLHERAQFCQACFFDLFGVPVACLPSFV